ncbi:MAG: GNAT family N-acetyltransferase [Actinobacteria bacterium]|nr:GNAT family N-acetyltransferase [Actinomycetota bacterium]
MRLLEELRSFPDSAPIEIAQFIADVNDGAVVVTAHAKGTLIGLVGARLAGDHAWTQLVAIHPEWRNLGIGSALSAGLENRLLHLGVRRVSALIGPGQVGEQALVNRGFVPVEGLKLYEKCLSLEPSEVRIIDKWGGEVFDDHRWALLTGMTRERELVNQRIVAPLSDPGLAYSVGLRLPSTVLMFGPPGTGKTTFAKALASKLRWPFIELLPSKLSGGNGTLANELREAFSELSRLEHVVIFIDEFDEIAPARDSRPSAAGVVNELLKSIPEFRQQSGKLLICATNFVGTIDPAVLRPGRFDFLIGIGPPDLVALTALWSQALTLMNFDGTKIAETLAKQSIGYTPGDVDLAAQRAAASAFSRAQIDGSVPVVSEDDLLNAIGRTQPSISPDMVEDFNAEVIKFERI